MEANPPFQQTDQGKSYTDQQSPFASREAWTNQFSQNIRSAAAAAAARVSPDDELSDSSLGSAVGDVSPPVAAYPEVGQWVPPPAPRGPPPAPPMPIPPTAPSIFMPLSQQQAPADVTQNPWNDFADRTNDPLRRIPWQQRGNLASTKDRCFGFKNDGN